MTDDAATAVSRRLQTERAALLGAGSTPGRAWVRAFSAAHDRAIADLATAAALPDFGLAVVAVGGSGRKELAPGSDVDLLVLHEGLDDDRLKAIVQAVVYPLWDAKLQVGYAVRTVKQMRAIARDELDAATALLDGRSLHGDGAILRRARDLVVGDLRRRPSRFLDALSTADRERRDRAGDAAEALEPDVKSGAGALRDVQSLSWAAAAAVGRPGLDPLVSAGYLGADDRSRLADAYDALLATRVALHLELGLGRPGGPPAGKGSDTLRLDLQQRVARRLGHVDGDDDRDTAAHRLLTQHYLDARVVDHAHRRAWLLMAADARRGRRLRRRRAEVEVDGFGLVDGVLTLLPDDLAALQSGFPTTLVDAADDSPHPLADASWPTRLFATLVREQAVLERRAASVVRRAVDRLDAPVPWTRDAAHTFVGALASGRHVVAGLAELDDTGLLVALVPEWAEQRGRPQRNPFHLYALDRHAWHAASELGRSVRDEAWAIDAVQRVDDRDALVLGTWLHDVGKARGEPHSETGIPVATAIVDRMDLPRATSERVAAMVRHHLLLPDVATKRDLSDPATIARVAATVGDRAALHRLHLLCAADGRATGPSAWSSWKAALISSLVTKVEAVLDADSLDADSHDSQVLDDLADGAIATARQAQELAPELGVEPDAVREHLARLPQRYAASVSARALVRHTIMASNPLAPGQVVTRVTPGEDRPDTDDATPEPGLGYDELDVVAIDSPGLFAKVAGVLSLHGASVTQAHAFTRDDGLAIDTFVVARPADVRSSWMAAVEADVDEAVAGRLALRARVKQAAAGEERRLARVPDVETVVTCEEDPSGRTTIVEIRTQDRLGVLFTIVMALAELELDIVLAKIQTMGPEAVDVFFVTTADGKTLDADHCAEVDLAVSTALDAA